MIFAVDVHYDNEEATSGVKRDAIRLLSYSNCNLNIYEISIIRPGGDLISLAFARMPRAGAWGGMA
jgi:hypothetical protein